MPSKLILRNFSANCYYHVANWGVEKRVIFNDDVDYEAFLFYLFIYTTPLPEVLVQFPKLPGRLREKNMSSEIRVVGYSLLPNHFHFLFLQKNSNTISNLMKRIINGYTMYYNKKHNRSGALLQGRYKAILVREEAVNPLLNYIINHEKSARSSGQFIDNNNVTGLTQTDEIKILTMEDVFR